jgi:hypothetical protein
MTSYLLYELETNNTYQLSIHQIITHIKQNPTNTYYKKIDNEQILINNNIVINTEFICHRINTQSELEEIDTQFGVELDIRDDHCTQRLILSHDPFSNGEYFDEYLTKYKHNTLILNIKSERVEIKCLELITRFNIKKYFFLDSSFPMIYLLNKEYSNQNIACRFSEYEPIEQFLAIKHMVKYLWIDCFSKYPLNKQIYEQIKSTNTRICLVSPELQKQENKIFKYRYYLIDNNMIPDMICCKIYNIIKWI